MLIWASPPIFISVRQAQDWWMLIMHECRQSFLLFTTNTCYKKSYCLHRSIPVDMDTHRNHQTKNKAKSCCSSPPKEAHIPSWEGWPSFPFVVPCVVNKSFLRSLSASSTYHQNATSAQTAREQSTRHGCGFSDDDTWRRRYDDNQSEWLHGGGCISEVFQTGCDDHGSEVIRWPMTKRGPPIWGCVSWWIIYPIPGVSP